MGSPFTAKLCRLLPKLVGDGPLADTLSAWPGDPQKDALALRLCAGLKFLSRQIPKLGRVYPPNPPAHSELTDVISGVCSSHAQTLIGWLASPPQTNEVGRAAIFLGGYLILTKRYGLPLSLFEIGASAGLNLFTDQYDYDLSPCAGWGERTSAVKCRSIWSGNMPDVSYKPELVTRRGSDLSPLDARDPETSAQMRAYIWADQPAREDRASAALTNLSQSDLVIEQADAAEWLEALVPLPPQPKVMRVIQHSIMWQYMPSSVQKRCHDAIQTMGAQATDASPLAWLRLESTPDLKDCAAFDLTTWPGGHTERLARADFHGSWAEWF